METPNFHLVRPEFLTPVFLLHPIPRNTARHVLGPNIFEHLTTSHHLHYHFLRYVGFWDFFGGSDGKETSCNAGYLGSIPGEENGYQLQYSCLGNPMDRLA